MLQQRAQVLLPRCLRDMIADGEEAQDGEVDGDELAGAEVEEVDGVAGDIAAELVWGGLAGGELADVCYGVADEYLMAFRLVWYSMMKVLVIRGRGSGYRDERESSASGDGTEG